MLELLPDGDIMEDPYYLAQRAMADLKASIKRVLVIAPRGGLTNAQIGRSLGIYTGHVEHEGHIPRTLLALMEKEGVVQQNPADKKWTLRSHVSDDSDQTRTS